jgi:glycosyltransferase involved in cell wall biosynthesis
MALRPKYGPDFLVEAIAIAAGDIPGIRCVIAGAGEMRAKLIEQAKILGVENRIVFPGRIPYPDMPEAMKGVDIFAMPSRYEELGVAALEASAMRKPVILTGTWGMREVAIDGETGYFIEPGDVDALAGFLVKLGRDAELRHKLGGAGREFVKANFEFERLMETADRYCAGIAGGSSI